MVSLRPSSPSRSSRPSLRYRFVCFLIWALRHKQFYSQSGDAFWRAVRRRRPRHGSLPCRPRRLLMKLLGWKFETQLIDGMPVFVLTPRIWRKGVRAGTRSPRTVLYLHGGGNVMEAVSTHWNFLSELIWRTGARIVVPQYPLAPDFACFDALRMILAVYEKLLESTPAEEILLMGDSAGGSLTLSCGMLFRELGLPQPRRLIMISPSLQISPPDPEDEEAKECDQRDVMLSCGSFATILAGWRGELEETDWRLQPAWGDFQNLPPMTLFTGTADVLNRGARLFRDRVQEALRRNPGSVSLDYQEAPDRFHCWVLIPVPESKAERKEIWRLVREV